MRAGRVKAGIFGKTVKAVSAVFPENYFLQVSRYRIESRRIPPAFDGYRILQLSDLHGCSFGRENRRLTEAVSSAAPDAVVMTGDMADRQTKRYDGIFRLSGTLCEKYPVYSVFGNHEQELPGSRRRALVEGMRRQGVHILDNGEVRLERGGARVALFGVRVPMRCYRAYGRAERRPALTAEKIRRLLGDGEGPDFSILLAHNPFYFEAYAEWGADLTLCGHVHGGMVRLPGLGGLLSPERRFFPRYSAGIYESEKHPEKKMLVSRGLGSGARIRNRPEIVVLTLARPSGLANQRKEFD